MWPMWRMRGGRFIEGWCALDGWVMDGGGDVYSMHKGG